MADAGKEPLDWADDLALEIIKDALDNSFGPARRLIARKLRHLKAQGFDQGARDTTELFGQALMANGGPTEAEIAGSQARIAAVLGPEEVAKLEAESLP